MPSPDPCSRRLPFKSQIPEGDNRPRLVCQDCGFIHYVNPKVVVGSVVFSGDRILLCRRSIDPRKGYWTLPSGFMEDGETTEEGAKREAFEETGGRLELDSMLAVYSIPHISQVQIIYRARLLNPSEIGPRPESEEVALFLWDDIPWSDLAFSSNEWALKHAHQVMGQETYPPFSQPVDASQLPDFN